MNEQAAALDELSELEAALLAVIDRAAGVQGAHFNVRPAPMHGGFWASIYAFELAAAPPGFEGGLVLRVMPDERAAARETFVQRWMADHGAPTPEVLAWGVEAGLGGPFSVMRRADGRSPLSDLQLGPALLRSRRLLRDLPVLLARVAADLHDIAGAEAAADFIKAGFDEAVGPESVLGTVRRSADAAIAAGAGASFAELHDWLVAHLPNGDGIATVCHGDLHPFNVLVDGERVTVLDWTNARVCPPEMDVGFTAGFLRCPPMRVPLPIRPVVALIGRRMADSFVRSYATRRPLNVDEVRWWEALQLSRCLSELVWGRLHPGGVVGPEHPFEGSAASMRRRLRRLTGIRVELPAR